jgi:membrane protein
MQRRCAALTTRGTLESVAGRENASAIIRRFGLTGEAAHAVRQALTSPAATSTAVSGLSWVFFVLGGIAAAGAIQELYERVFEVTGRGLRDTPRRVVWLAGALGAGKLAGGRAGRRQAGWRELFPSALATGICWLGMVIVFRLTLSSTIASDYRKYGSAGVVFAIMTLLIAIGVVIILGALIGTAWRARHEHPPREQPESPSTPVGGPVRPGGLLSARGPARSGASTS